MPSTVGGWAWWGTTTIVLSSVIGLGINLATPWVQKQLDKFSEERRDRKQKRNKAEYEYALKMVELIKKDSSVLTIVFWRASRYDSLSINIVVAGAMIALLGAIISTHFTDTLYTTFMILAGAIASGLGIVTLSFGVSLRRIRDIYDLIIYMYSRDMEIPSPPDYQSDQHHGKA